VESTEQEKDMHFLTDHNETEQQEGCKGGSGSDKIVKACYDLEWKESEVDPE
jgi:hypothetical protein